MNYFQRGSGTGKSLSSRIMMQQWSPARSCTPACRNPHFTTKAAPHALSLPSSPQNEVIILNSGAYCGAVGRAKVAGVRWGGTAGCRNPAGVARGRAREGFRCRLDCLFLHKKCNKWHKMMISDLGSLAHVNVVLRRQIYRSHCPWSLGGQRNKAEEAT